MRKNTLESVWNRIKKTTPENCWLWTGNTNDKGYPIMRVQGAMLKPYRIVHELVKGPIPKGMLVMHLCNIPLCCNPSHLKAGTYKENSQHAALTRTGLTPEVKLQIKSLYYSEGRKQKELASMFKVDQTTISKVVLGKLD